jgi:hypothetical protein
MSLRHLQVDAVPPPLAYATVIPESLGRAIRELYCELHRRYNRSAKNFGNNEMPQWDGGTDRWGVKFTAIWPKIASFMLQHQVDPAVYLHVQFAETAGRSLPKPSMLISPESLTRYQAYLQRASDILVQDKDRSAMHVQRRLLQQESARGSVEQKTHTVLMDETVVHAEPLFRFCLGFKFGINRVIERYYQAALHQYVFQQHLYDAAWGTDFIPEKLRQDANQLRARMGY